MKNVFKWENSIIDYLNPSNHTTPLVQLTKELNKYESEWIHIYAKLLQNLPLYNVKSIPAYNMIEKSWSNNNKIIVESSSWNTAYSLCIIWKAKWYKWMISYASEEVWEWKLDMLRFFWSKIIINKEPICPNPNDTNSSINIAKKLWDKEWYINFWQYWNKNNPEWHYNYTWPQIYDQLEWEVDYFFSSLWTTWTFLWTSKYLKEKDKNIKSIWVVRKPNNPIPWPRTENLLNQIEFDRKKEIDFIEKVWTRRAYFQSLLLSRNWIIAWPSSWMNLEWVFQFIRNNYSEIKNKIKKEKKEINIVFICCDLPFLYIKDYFNYLDDELFPEIINKHLLWDYKFNIYDNNIEIEWEEFCKKYFTNNIEQIWKKINNKEAINTNPNIVLIDIRDKKQFSHFFIPNSKNIKIDLIENYIKKIKSKEIYLICEYWWKSNELWIKLKNKWYNCHSIKWWTIEWSKLNLPRIKNEVCFF